MDRLLELLRFKLRAFREVAELTRSVLEEGEEATGEGLFALQVFYDRRERLIDQVQAQDVACRRALSEWRAAGPSRRREDGEYVDLLLSGLRIVLAEIQTLDRALADRLVSHRENLIRELAATRRERSLLTQLKTEPKPSPRFCHRVA